MPATIHTLLQVSGPSHSTLSPKSNEEGDGQVCLSNISPRERRKRLIGGVIQFVITLAILATLIATGADRWWRLPLLLLFWGAASGFFQWRDKT
jgi:hypothetical protein